jgi:nucleoside-diphosphate-sugar epimerase
MFSLVFISFLISLSITDGKQTGANNILIFGGNGFIGASTVQKLFPGGHSVTIVNRGNWYWDTRDTVYPNVKHISCDRYSGALEDSCPDLVKFVSSADKIDFVIDFSAFDSKAVVEVLSLLGEKTGVYIFISTDSVYEVVAKDHAEPSREDDAHRPKDEVLRDTLAQNDNYGHEKLAAEEVIVKARGDNTGPRYVILRLPDVIGPRDNTDRWWQYQLWLILSTALDKPLLLPSHLRGQPLTLVYVEDVASLIKQIINNPDPNILDSAYNIGYEETYFLSDIIKAIKNELGLQNAGIQWVSSDKNTYFLYPSVTNGPINVTKALSSLGWKTTPWKDVVKHTTNFYEDATRLDSDKFSWHIEKVLYKLKYNVFKGLEAKVDRVLGEVYGYKQAKDEL